MNIGKVIQRTTGKKVDRDFGFDVNLAISG